jgi:stage III sporulation protein AG
MTKWFVDKFGKFNPRDKSFGRYMLMVLAAGVLMMLLGRSLPAVAPHEPPQGAEAQGTADPPPTVGFLTERQLESRLEEAFAAIQDVGRVRVLLSFAPERERVFASDVSVNDSYSKEADAQGGTRETRNSQKQQKTIIVTDKAGVDQPLVLREAETKIAGVVIIAEGGDSVFVKDALTKAACTVLGIEANKVQVLKMKGD